MVNRIGNRVLFLTTDIARAGGVQYAGRLILRALQDWPPAPPRVTLLTINDVSQDLEPWKSGCQAFGGGGRRIATTLKARALLRRERWDLILLGHLHLAPLVMALASKPRPPSVAIIHGIEAWQPLTRARRWALHKVDRLVFVSHHSQRRATEANPWLDKMQSVVCPLGLLPEQARVRPSTGEDEPPKGHPFNGNAGHEQAFPFLGQYALMIGRMARSESYKGHEELIRIWADVVKHRQDFPLLIVGKGDDQLRLEALARQLAAPVQFLGAVDDATRDLLMTRCRCFCMPSRGEGLGLVYLEAMRAGKPILAGTTDAGAEAVVDGITGRVVDPADSRALLNGILDVSGDQAAAMGEAGRQRFLEHYRYERFLDRFCNQLDGVTGKFQTAAVTCER
jgi:phosphatidylinositol alpha-1,6-mannosyltransferase